MKKAVAVLGIMAVTILAACEDDPLAVNGNDTPRDSVGAIRGLVIIGSMPTADVEVTLAGTTTMSTNNAGEYRFVDLVVGYPYTVSIAADAVPEGVEMHVSDTTVLAIPETHVSYVNFYGSKRP